MAKATTKNGVEEVGIEQKLTELDAAKGVIAAIQAYPAESQRRILKVAADIVGCAPTRNRRTKAELAAEAAANAAPVAAS